MVGAIIFVKIGQIFGSHSLYVDSTIWIYSMTRPVYSLKKEKYKSKVEGFDEKFAAIGMMALPETTRILTESKPLTPPNSTAIYAECEEVIRDRVFQAYCSHQNIIPYFFHAHTKTPHLASEAQRLSMLNNEIARVVRKK